MKEEIAACLFILVVALVTGAVIYVVCMALLCTLKDLMESFKTKWRSTHPVKGYKGFMKTENSLKCIDMVYKVGNEYRLPDPPVPCEQGFHFCRRLSDVFAYYYPNRYNAYCEVEAFGDVAVYGDKSCTNGIRIVRELSVLEIREILEKEQPRNHWLLSFPQVPTTWVDKEVQTETWHQRMKRTMKRRKGYRR